jgi:hypothetical protein
MHRHLFWLLICVESAPDGSAGWLARNVTKFQVLRAREPQKWAVEDAVDIRPEKDEIEHFLCGADEHVVVDLAEQPNLSSVCALKRLVACCSLPLMENLLSLLEKQKLGESSG